MALGSSTRRYLSHRALESGQPTWLTSCTATPDYCGQPPIDWRLPRASPGMIGRDASGRFVLGPGWGELSSARGEDRLIAAAGPILSGCVRPLAKARSCTAAKANIASYRVSRTDLRPARHGSNRNRVADEGGFRRTGCFAWEDPATLQQELRGARFSAAALRVRQLHWAQSVGQREPG